MKSCWAIEIVPNPWKRCRYCKRLKRAYEKHGKPVPARVEQELRAALAELSPQGLYRKWQQWLSLFLLTIRQRLGSR